MARRKHTRPRGDVRWESAAVATASRWRHLGESDRARLVDQAEKFDESRHWEGLDGFVITPEMRGLVSTTACVLTLNLAQTLLSDVTSVLIAPASVTKTARHRMGGSVVGEETACVLGEALLHGPVRLAGDRLSMGDVTVVLHEFAHKIDMADGDPDGTPPIADRPHAREFQQVAQQSLDEIRSGADPFPMRAYAATNRAEFFAVATEAFFIRPTDLHARFELLYDVLATFYRQDPARSTG